MTEVENSKQYDLEERTLILQLLLQSGGFLA